MVGMLRNRFVVSQGALFLMELMTFFFSRQKTKIFTKVMTSRHFQGYLRGPGSEGGVFNVVSFHFSAGRLLVNRVQNWL